MTQYNSYTDKPIGIVMGPDLVCECPEGHDWSERMNYQLNCPFCPFVTGPSCCAHDAKSGICELKKHFVDLHGDAGDFDCVVMDTEGPFTEAHDNLLKHFREYFDVTIGRPLQLAISEAFWFVERNGHLPGVVPGTALEDLPEVQEVLKKLVVYEGLIAEVREYSKIMAPLKFLKPESPFARRVFKRFNYGLY